MYAKTDLKNLFGFLRLRCDSHAQLEIRQYANIMAGIVQELFPLSFEAWIDYAFCSASFSRLDRQMVSYLMGVGMSLETHAEDIKAKAESIGMGKREFTEFVDKLQAPEVPDFSLSEAPLYQKAGE
jgi:thymidylate synthase (FAD)